MAVARRRLVARFERLTWEFNPAQRRALLAAWRELQGALSETAIAALLVAGGAEALVSALVEASRVAYVDFQERMRRTAAVAAARFRVDLPRGARFGVAFDILNPEVIAAIEQLDSRIMQDLTDALGDTIRQHAAAGAAAGRSPAAIARSLRPLLPLAPRQAEAVRNFERMLRAGDPAALTRALRDRRYDRLIRRAAATGGLTDAQIGPMVQAYQRRMVAFNAETLSRTTTLDTLRLGQRLSWIQAAERGLFDRGRLMKERLAVAGPTGDGRNRPAHLAMHGEIRPADAPYSNGEVVSGDLTYNCRCVDRYFLAPAAASVAA